MSALTTHNAKWNSEKERKKKEKQRRSTHDLNQRKAKKGHKSSKAQTPHWKQQESPPEQMQAPSEHVDANFQIFWIFHESSPLIPLVDNVWIKVKMQKCKTKHTNIYMSFSNRPDLVSKARNETKSTHMDHSTTKALPQVIYWNLRTWQSKFSDLRNFIKRWLISHVKAYPCHNLAKNMHNIQRSYKEVKFSTKDHCKHP
jgi:hypothetical protein